MLKITFVLIFHQTNTQYLRRFVRLTESTRRKVTDEKYEMVGAALFPDDDLPESLDWREKGTSIHVPWIHSTHCTVSCKFFVKVS